VQEKSQKYKEGKFVLERYYAILLSQLELSFFLSLMCVFTDCSCHACPFNRGRIVDEIDFSTEFCVEGCVSMSDTEDD